jgi:hypothetical protein
MMIEIVPKKSPAILEHRIIGRDCHTYWQEYEVNVIKYFGVLY